MVLKAVVDDGARTATSAGCASYTTRFAGVVFPGETLRVRMWGPATGRVQVTATAVDRDDAPVLADTVVEHA